MTENAASQLPRRTPFKTPGRASLAFRYFSPFAAIIVLLVVILIVEERQRSFQEVANHQNIGVALGAGALRKQVSRSFSDLLFLSESNELRDYFATGSPGDLRELENELVSFSKGMALYDQVRFLDEKGQERVRVNYQGGAPRSVPANELQNKSDRYYFSETMYLKNREMYLSPLDLNVEQGKIEQPLKPMIRIAMPVDSAGKRRGVLVLNLFGTTLIEEFRAATAGISSTAMLLNSDGYWLVSPQAADEWGFMFNRATTLPGRYPEAWKLIRASASGHKATADGLWTWETVYPLEAEGNSAQNQGSHKDYFWKVVSFVPRAHITALVSPQLLLQALFGLALLFVAALWAWLHAGSTIKEYGHIEQLRNNEERFHALFSTMAEGFALHEIITDGAGTPVDYRFVEVNPAFEKLTGMSAAETIGKTVLEIFPGTEKIWIERYGQVALTGMPDKFSEFSKETGRAFEVSAYCPAPGRFACVFSDVTANRHLEDQLRQSQKLESIGTLAGGVAHDFNNILTVIMGAGAMLQMKLTGNADLEPFVRQILSSSERAAKLTHNLLAFSRKQTIKPFKVDVGEIVKGLHDFLARVIGEDVRLKTFCSPEPLPVFADRGQIEQVLMNLAANARDAMPDGGTLTLETSLVQSCDHSLELEGCRPGRFALITVSDGGIGMDSATCQRIFEPFFTTKEIGYGTGLGLSMAYGIIKQHEGTIKVYSEPGEGTVFKIFLPLQGGAAENNAEAVEREFLGGSETILLVEDDPEVQASNSAILECVGYNVICAANGEESIALFEHYCNTISLVILDVIMPGMNGKDVNEFLKALRPNVKVLFVSGYTADILNRKGVLTEDINFMSKPLEPHLFLGKVRELIDS